MIDLAVVKSQLNTLKFCLISIVLGMIVSWIIGMYDLPDNIGFGGFIPLLAPIVIGVVTLIIYFIMRKFTKKYLWMVALIGVIWNIYFAFNLQSEIQKGYEQNHLEYPLDDVEIDE